MTTDLETLIRDALGVESIGAGDLLEPRLRASRHHHAARPWATVAAAVVVVLAAAGIGLAVSHHGSNDRPTGPTTQPFIYLGPVTRTTEAAGNELVIQPPKAAKAKLTASQAFYVLCAPPGAPPNCAGARRADIVLGLLTTPHSGHERADGTLKPSVDNVLSYVITWRNVPCPDFPRGAATLGNTAGSPTSQRLPTACTETDAVNASTGRTNAGDYSDSDD